MDREILKVFIASSAELNEERQKCIVFLNDINQRYPNLDIQPLLWEYNMVYGNNPSLETIQKAINPILQESDLCIFLFYSKIGKYTLEEFNLANALQRKYFVFFKTNFAPSNEVEVNDFNQLLKFKKGLDDTVLNDEYDDIKTFELLLFKRLTLHFSRKTPSDLQGGSAGVNALLAVLAEKQVQISKLQSEIESNTNQNYILKLESEVREIQSRLSKSDEIIQQHIKDKNDLTASLKRYNFENEFKEKASIAISKGQLSEAKEYLNESAKDSFKKTASTFYELGKISKLELNYRSALENFEFASKIDDRNEDYLFEAAQLSRELGLYPKSEIYLKKILEVHSEDDTKMAMYYNILGVVQNQLGEFQDAIKNCLNAIRINILNFGENHPYVAANYCNLAGAYMDCGNYNNALRYLNLSLEINLYFFEGNHEIVANDYANLGKAFSLINELETSIISFNKAVAIYKNLNLEAPSLATIYNNLCVAHGKKGEYSLSLTYCELALKIYKEFFGEEHPDIATCYNNFGLIYFYMKDYSKSIHFHKLSLEIDSKYHGNSHFVIARDYNNLGLSYTALKEYKNGVKYFELSLLIGKQYLASNHPQIVSTHRNLQIALNELSKE